MPTVTELSQPQRFIQSALGNVDLAHWFVWPHGICVGYWDDTEGTHSVCCWWTVLNRAYLFQTEHIMDVCVDEHQIAILSSEGFHTWDGQLIVDSFRSPAETWKNVHIATWGVTGFSNHGYHLWDRETQSVKRLPIGVQKIWGVSQTISQEILWSHWGQFFVLDCQSGQVSALEPLKDTMDDWLALRDGWWLAIYENSLHALHRTKSTLRFDSLDIMDVSIPSGRNSVLILLATGQVLEWCPNLDPIPQEVAEVEGELFIGDGMIFNNGEVELFK